MSVRGRYAPSPTGNLHLGNARTALVAWLNARSGGGDFVMRVEDLDGPRTVADAVKGNLDELRWLGLDWDEGPEVGGPYAPYLQSERSEHYRAALESLTAKGLVFPCYLSRKDLRGTASAPHGEAPVYGAKQRDWNRRVAAEKQAQGRTPSLRFKTEPRRIAFNDLLAGPQQFEVEKDVGDFVLRRSDGLWAYQLAVVVDDLAMNITQVVRGDDLLSSTAAQGLLYEALGAEPPSYAHVPLLLDLDGKRMAKRKGSLTLKALKQTGVRPERIVGWLAYTLDLTSKPVVASPAELLERYRLESLRRSAYRLTSDDLKSLGL